MLFADQEKDQILLDAKSQHFQLMGYVALMVRMTMAAQMKRREVLLLEKAADSRNILMPLAVAAMGSEDIELPEVHELPWILLRLSKIQMMVFLELAAITEGTRAECLTMTDTL